MLTSENFPAELIEVAELSLKEYHVKCNDASISDRRLEKRLRDATAHMDKEELAFKLSRPQFEIKNGILMYEDLIYLINEDLKKEVMEMRHVNPLTGHFGYDKTFELIIRYFVSVKNEVGY